MLPPGTELDSGYRIDRLIGRGGMGAVYEATQLWLNRTVALKVLAPHLSADPVFRERFAREAMHQAAIDNPHVITVYEAGESEVGLFIAMRLVRGGSLKDAVVTGLEPARAIAILGQIAEALDAAHRMGVVHRDVKPQNILVEPNGWAFLADFGLIKAPGHEPLTRSDAYVGSLDYVAPEQIRGGGTLGPWSDVYALGAVLYEALVGIVPYPRDSEAALLYAHLRDAVPSVHERRPELPGELDRVIARAMAKEPADRYGSAGELIAAATRALGDGAGAAAVVSAPVETDRSRFSDTVADRPVGVAAPPVPVVGAPRRIPWTPVLVVLALIALATAGGFLLGHAREKTAAPLERPVSAGGVALRFPDGWRRSRRAVRIPGLPLVEPIALVRRDGGAALLAGRVHAEGPRLLPAALARRPAARSTVRLGAVTAYRYSAMRVPKLSRPLTLFVAPTTRGVVTVACVGRGPRELECEAIAATLRLRGARALPLGPDPAYGRALGGVIGGVDRARRSALVRFASARTPAAQAAAAKTVALAYAAAATRLGRTRVSPRDASAARALVLALGRAGSAYRRLGAAARRVDARGYARARTGVRGADVAVVNALGRLGALGYRLAR